MNIAPVTASLPVEAMFDPGGSARGAPALALPPAPPELVGRFEALMARVPPEPSSLAARSAAVDTAVAGIDSHLKSYSDITQRLLIAAEKPDLSLAELNAVHMQSMVDMAMLSMNQSAYVSVTNSSKSSLQSLMKSQ